MTGKIVKIGVGLLVVAVAASTVAVRAANSPDTYTKRKIQRMVERHRATEQYRNELNREWLRGRVIDGARGPAVHSFGTPIIRESSTPRDAFSSTNALVPPPSPGQDIGFTSYDYQANNSQGFNVARTPAGTRIHFTWMSFKYIPPNDQAEDRYVLYSGYDDIGDYPAMDAGTGYNGIEVTGATNRGGYCGIDVDNLNHAQIAMHQAENDYTIEPYEPWHVQLPFGDDTYQIYGLTGQDNSCAGTGGGTGGVLWPRLTADRSNLILHEIAHSNVNDCPNEKLWYWRFDGVSTWAGPALVGNTSDISYVLAADATTNKVAVVTHETEGGFSDVAYIESATNGTDWLALVPNVDTLPNKHFVTNYGDPEDFTGYLHLTTTYDNSGALHIMWDEQENANSEHIAIKHWNSSRGTIRDVTLGYWDRTHSGGVFNLNLSKLTMGIGDGSTTCGGGSNNNYVYATYTKFGGNTVVEQNDYSNEYSYEGRAGGFLNGEIYLAISNSGGNTWSPPVNLTNTKTPQCHPGLADLIDGDPEKPDSVCRSEHWATIGRVVKDIDVFFISDIDAGGIPQGEGSWQLNPVHYLKLSGSGIAPAGVCPEIAPVFEATLSSDPLCEYHATKTGFTEADLIIRNLGNADLNDEGAGGITFTDFPGAPTMVLTGDDLGPYTILAGADNIEILVTMNSNGAAEGLYLGQISITHNDNNVNNPSPRVYTVEFFVFDVFNCPETELLKTSVASPGSLQLAIGSDGRFASQAAEGGLWRFTDSSSTIFDASLIMAHGTQGPGSDDTTVFLRFFDRLSNGQNGWRSQSELWVDTVGYGAGTQPYATAGAYMTTSDSIMAVNVSWYFSQSASADEVVIVKYQAFPGPHFTGGTVSGVATGILGDFDVIPSQKAPLDTMQSGANNHGLGDDPLRLAYMRGVNRAGTSPSGNITAERFRGGVAVPSSAPFTGAYVGNNSDNQTGGGPTDGHLYNLLLNVAGVEVGETADTDLYIMVGFDNGASYTKTGTTWANSKAQYRSTNIKEFYAVLASDTVGDAEFKTAVTAGAALVNAGSFPGCAICPCRYDPGCNGVADVVDVTHVVGGAFRNVVADPSLLGGPGTADDHPTQAGCNFDSRDVDANGVIDVLDVTKMVGAAFRNIAVTANNSFVDPCTRWRKWNSTQI
jgi:hypothetical protein